MSGERVRAAELEVQRKRATLLADMNAVSQQFEPHRLMQEAWDKTKDKGADLAENAVDAVSRRPVAAGAVVAGIIAFLTRDSLMSAAGKLVNGAKAKAKGRRAAQRKPPTPKVQTEAVE